MSSALRRAATALALLIASLFASCGGGEASSDPDAGGCAVNLSVFPSTPMAPTELVVTAVVTGVDGVLEFAWSASGPDGALDATIRAPDDSEVGVIADVAGPYTISVIVDDTGDFYGGSCSDSLTVNVLPAGGASGQLVLRFAPPDEAAAPPPQQGTPITVYEETNWDVGVVTLTAGKTIAGLLTGPDGPLAAYLRLATSDFTTEFFAGGTGAFQVKVLDRAGDAYDVTIVPYEPTVAPDRQLLIAGDLETGVFLDRGDLVDGVVVDSAGAAVAGATVAIAAGDLPASVVTTGVDGHFTAPIRAAHGALSIAVVPAATSTLPRIELTEIAGVSPPAVGELVTVTLGDLPLATVGGQAVVSDGASLAGARVTYVATSPAAGGSVAIGAATPVDAPFAARVTVVADAGGALPAVSLPYAIYDVVVDAPASGFDGEGPALGVLDLTGGAPPTTPTWATAAVVPRTVHVVDVQGTVVAGARVTAVALGIGGIGAGVTTRAVTATTGNAIIDLVPGMGYDLIVDPPRDVALTRARMRIAAGDPWPPSIALGTAITLRGTVRYPSGAGPSGVRVEAICSPCGAGEDPDAPLAETSTGAGGAFTLGVPSPVTSP